MNQEQRTATLSFFVTAGNAYPNPCQQSNAEQGGRYGTQSPPQEWHHLVMAQREWRVGENKNAATYTGS